MIDALPTEFMVGAAQRTAMRSGVAFQVRKHGDNDSGTIILKINLLNGTARVLTQARIDDKMAWVPVRKTDPMADNDAEDYINRQIRIDPDSWVIEIEDRLGRIWFDGKIISQNV